MRSLLVMGIPYQHAPEVSIVRTDCMAAPSAVPEAFRKPRRLRSFVPAGWSLIIVGPR